MPVLPSSVLDRMQTAGYSPTRTDARAIPRLPGQQAGMGHIGGDPSFDERTGQYRSPVPGGQRAGHRGSEPTPRSYLWNSA